MQNEAITSIRQCRTPLKTLFWVVPAADRYKACIAVNSKHILSGRGADNDLVISTLNAKLTPITAQWGYSPTKGNKVWAFILEMPENTALWEAEERAEQMAQAADALHLTPARDILRRKISCAMRNPVDKNEEYNELGIQIRDNGEVVAYSIKRTPTKSLVEVHEPSDVLEDPVGWVNFDLSIDDTKRLKDAYLDIQDWMIDQFMKAFPNYQDPDLKDFS